MKERTSVVQQVEFFDRFLQEAANWVSVPNVKHRSAAIALSDKPLTLLKGPQMISGLIHALEGPWWRSPAPHGRNWAWREEVPSHSPLSKEVALERRVAALSSERWTCQMSTCSGLRANQRDGRRAIDLVRRIGDEEYCFIELKVGTDHPLYAIFEILGYGLIYLLARHRGHCGRGSHNVMEARAIKLVVLAPASWYRFKKRGSGSSTSFEFNWLVDQINVGLAAEVHTRRISGLKAMSIQLMNFPDSTDLQQNVAAIEALLE